MGCGRVECGVVGERGEVHRVGGEWSTFVESGEEQEVLDEVSHADALLADAAHDLTDLVVADGSLAPEVDETADRRDRCPQLVGCVGDELSKLVFLRSVVRRA